MQAYEPSTYHVDEFGYDPRLSLPKIVRKKRYSVILVSSIVRPVRLIPDFELLACNKKEYFVRYNIEKSTIVDSVYSQCIKASKEK